MFVATGIGPYSGPGRALQALRAGEGRIRAQPLPIRGRAALYRAHERLATHKYLVGDTYTIVDMALWGWARLIPSSSATKPGQSCQRKRLHDEVDARPAAARATSMKDRHSFKQEIDEEAKRHMFWSISRA